MAAHLLANHDKEMNTQLNNLMSANPYADPTRFPQRLKYRQANRRAARAVKKDIKLKYDPDTGPSSADTDEDLWRSYLTCEVLSELW